MMTEELEYHAFLVKVQSSWMESKGQLRYGQALFNVLHDCRPDLSEQVRATLLDPFFKHHDSISPEFWAFIERNW